MIWSEFLLDEVATVFNGKTPSKLEQRDDGYPVLKIKDVSESGKFKGMFESFVDVELANKSKLKLIQSKDTLILNAAHNADYVGSKQYCAEQEVVGSLPTGEWLIIRGKNNKVDPTYLNFWFRLESTKFNIRNMVKGIHLYPKDVARLKIPLPPLSEQQKIAAILDVADSLRQKDQQLVERYTALSQSLFLEMFGDPVTNPMGWETKTLENILSRKSRNGLYLPKDKYTTDGIEMVHMSDAFYGVVSLEKLKKVCLTNDELNTYQLSENDLLIARRSLTYEGAAKPCRIPKSDKPLVYESSLIRITPNQKLIDTMYLYFFFSNEIARKKYVNMYVSRSTISGINNKGLNSIKILIPPITIQNQFAERIQCIEAQKQQAQQSLEKSEALFNSLLQRAFTGELTAKRAA